MGHQTCASSLILFFNYYYFISEKIAVKNNGIREVKTEIQIIISFEADDGLLVLGSLPALPG